ncbi:alpha/beta hydrolase-fold protein [Niveibacterium sp. 24ML]|uniref:alpha/beta hydrolase n=1 Tax=Niveibacterium sp. 24ML TaxID=2985512 RepID=UPI00226F92A9|nr:alpha/beta hydrolase-fold protein [Niveibacterium sp. 24ML]MCX9155683.1 alpha/beta hydrolase-fold protein [Niveibacterium sp. 24ML]
MSMGQVALGLFFALAMSIAAPISGRQSRLNCALPHRMRQRLTPACLALLTGFWLAKASADQSSLPDCSASTAMPYLACLTSATNRPEPPHDFSGGRILHRGDTLNLRWRGAASAVQVEGTYGNYALALHPVAVDEWAASVRVPHLASLTERFTFIATRAGGDELHDTIHFSGPEALPRSAQRGAVETVTLPSRHFAQGRQVKVWLPPGHAASQRYPVIYIADGAAHFGDELLTAMQSGRLPAMVVVGIEADPAERFAEYVDFPKHEGLPSNPARFAAHERFIIETLLPWAESNFGASNTPADRTLAGFSNGADWAAAMALRHPELFGRAIVMSPIMVSQYAIPDAPGARFDLSAGALEPPFALATACFALRLHAKGHTVTLRWWPHTHSPEQWRTAFPAALLNAPAAALPDARSCDVFRAEQP